MEFDHHLIIDATADDVFDVLVDIESWPQWTRTMTSLVRLGEGDLAVGSRVRISQPHTSARTWVVTELVRPTTFAWESRQAGVHLVARHDHCAQRRQTSARLSVTVSGTVGRIAAPLSAPRIRQFLALEAAGLAARCADPAYAAPDLPPSRTRERRRR